MKQREAIRYLRDMGYKPSILGKWVDSGMVHRRKDGDTANCSVYYSFSEIQQAVLAAKIEENV